MCSPNMGVQYNITHRQRQCVQKRPRQGHSRDLQGQTDFWYDSTTYHFSSGGQVNKLIYNYLQALCKREEDWSTHLCQIAMGHNHCSITGSRYFSPYFSFTGRNLTLPVDSKLLKYKHSGNTVVDEFVRTLLPKLDHIKELARLNVQDFRSNYKKRMTVDFKQNQPS